MFKQFFVIGLIALAAPSVFGDLVIFSDDNCKEVLRVYPEIPRCLEIPAANSYLVVGNPKVGWLISSKAKCGGKSFLIGAGRGCINKSVVGFDAHSARPVWG